MTRGVDPTHAPWYRPNVTGLKGKRQKPSKRKAKP